MTRYEIIEAAREAGFYNHTPMYFDDEMLEAFANLVAAKKQEDIIKVIERLGTWAHIHEIVSEIKGEQA